MLDVLLLSHPMGLSYVPTFTMASPSLTGQILGTNWRTAAQRPGDQGCLTPSRPAPRIATRGSNDRIALFATVRYHMEPHHAVCHVLSIAVPRSASGSRP
jgi:hypothetical protein